MSERKGEEEEKAGPSMKREPEESEEEAAGTSQRLILPSYAGQYEAPTQTVSGQEPSTSRVTGAMQPPYTVPHPPLRVKRPGRPRIHPPKPVGISKPRGRPRGSKNKKPRKRRDTSTTLVERPPKRPRGRPRKWPPEMWEGFQRSQYAAATQQMQQLQRQQPSSQEMPGPSHMYYEEHMPHQMPRQEESSVPPPLSHLPFHMVSQQEPQELSHLMPMPLQPPQQIPQPPHLHTRQQQLHLHHPLHPPPPPPPPHPMQRQEEQMLLIRPLYLQEQEQQQQQQQQQREQAEMLLSQEEQQRRYYQEQMHPPHTSS